MDITLKLQFTFIYILSKTKVTNFTWTTHLQN